MKLSEIAKRVGLPFQGEDREIEGVSGLDHPVAGTLGFIENKRMVAEAEASVIAAFIVPEGVTLQKPFIQSKNPKYTFSRVVEWFSPYTPYEKGVSPQAYVHPSAKLGEGVTVMPFACIMEGAEIGDNTVIYPHVFIGKGVKIGKDCLIKAGVKIDDLTTLGDRVIIHHNTVVGGDGFGYVVEEGKNMKIPQIGRIRIGNDVEIGACVTIDRAALGETVIEDDVKIDNLVQIAHNVHIGAHSIIVAQVGIAGSTSLGEGCILAGQVGVADHVKIGDRVVVMAQSGIEDKEVPSGKILFGTPARDFMEQKRILAAQLRLPELVKRVGEIEKRMGIERE
ncbi:UDP-3-O-[3-hydroxymyristoyl] glucosamine N-acyltransferase [Brevinematales bacterium NS]|nr:UDP-3-O-[3-hydroxymyristoyl] glucosamine N-acyltransferase [Brevinematales bacterium NS]